MNDKTVLITGYSGFIGTSLTSVLGNIYPKIKIIGLDKFSCANNLAIHVVDLLNLEITSNIIKEIKPDYIFHMAGAIYTKDWRELYLGNVKTTINIMEAVKNADIPCRIVIPGSAAEYGVVPLAELPITETRLPNPTVPYGVAKVWQTTVGMYYKQIGLEVVVGRLFNIIGVGMPEGLSVGAFAKQLRDIKRGLLPPKVLVGNLKPKRDFIDIIDVCRGLIAIASAGRSGEIYNICSGHSVSMEQILRRMIEEANIEVAISVDLERIKKADIQDIFGSPEKIFKETGWRSSVPLSESIATLIGHADHSFYNHQHTD